MMCVIDVGVYEMFGEIFDDVVGEVFDKIVKLIGFGYLGGLEVLKFVEMGMLGVVVLLCLMLYLGDFDFSFSGLKMVVFM